MSGSTYNFIVVTNKNQLLEYVIQRTDVANQAEAESKMLDQFIKNNLGFEKRFALSENNWNNIKTAVTADLSLKIKIINGLCKDKSMHIKNVYMTYVTLYSAK